MKNENSEIAGITFVVMPVEVLQDKNLTSSEKILYCYLNLFKKGVCFQSNEKLAEMTGLDESTVKRGLKKLGEMKYIFVEFVNNNSAMRRIYTIMDNPKKLEYLARKGLFSLDIKEVPKEEPVEELEEEEEPVKPSAIIDNGRKPRRENYASDDEYEKAYYKWNSVVIQ